LKSLFNLLENNRAVTSLLEKKGRFVVDDTLGIALLVASAYKKKPQNYTLVTTNLYNAQRLYDLMAGFLGEDNCLFFPVDELLRAESIATSKEMLAQRIYVMNELRSEQTHVLITHAAGVMRYLPNPLFFHSQSIEFSVGKEYKFSTIRKTLIESGYINVNKVDQSLQFALRGDILDIYSVNLSAPVRIEFFGDQVESIRYFDIATQSSVGKVMSITILPASDILFSEKEVQNLKERVELQLPVDKETIGEYKYEILKAKTMLDVERIASKDYHQTIYKYMGFAEDNHYSLLDYTHETITLVCNKPQFDASSELLSEEALNYFSELLEGGQLMSHLSMYQDPGRVFGSHSNVLSASEHYAKDTDILFSVRPIIGSSNNLANSLRLIQSYLGTAEKIIIALSTKQQIDAVKAILDENVIIYSMVEGMTIPKTKVALTLLSLEEGFELVDEKIIYLTSKEIFGYRSRISRFLNRFKEAVILKSYEDLEPGDYVVHEYNGIGQFLDIKTLEIDGIHRDFLHIAYAGTDVLYVPLSQFKLVRKFIGKEGAAPKLNRLNSTEWEKTKRKIKERVNVLADRLIELYAQRAKIQGIAFNPDDSYQEEFEAQFPFDLTPDQLRSLNEIKADMEKPTPMDRLLCGDVGFGKTEVAFRAAFKAISNGKQVALLCPTTLLARQHYEIASERFASFGVRIAILSRLVPEPRQKQYIQEIREGKIHFVIGTHRLLSKEVAFKDLGLLIVDEEQRFGVEQKERIKEMKTSIDVLTLSATPIPRTLQISLLGIRQLSEITTAPMNRMPIQTYVIPYKEAVIKELIERELGRMGQVFYLHNQVSNIEQVAGRIQHMVKNAIVGVVHGRMDRNEIEDVMLKFYNAEINVLVCTSIIENGIDIANANMIIVENADTFGLSQLYQIKGRVGRGNRIAYAYLLYKEGKVMNETAAKRLKAIQDFTELGSGYKIAQRDLMIRGAGDILGPEQAGFIDTVGIDMYLKLLNEAIEEKKTGVVAETVRPQNTLSVDAYIPSTYAEKGDKIELYQDIEATKNFEELAAIHKRIRDIYGRLPEEVERLIRKKKIDLISAGPAFESLRETTEYIEVKMSQDFSAINGIGNTLFKSIMGLMQYVKVFYMNKELKVRLFKRGDWFTHLEELLVEIARVYDTSKPKTS